MINNIYSSGHIGRCAFCGDEDVSILESHIIPKFVFKWIKDTSPTPYFRRSDNVNRREQDGLKEYLLCEICEQNFSALESDFSENFFKKIANYQKQSSEVLVSESMRLFVLSIFWRGFITSLHRSNDRTIEDDKALHTFMTSLRKQILENNVTTKIYITPIIGDPPFFDLPIKTTYFLDRVIAIPDIRFFDSPHRFYTVIKLPFMFFYITSEDWIPTPSEKNIFTKKINLNDFKEIPIFLRDHINWMVYHFELSKKEMSPENIKKIYLDISNVKLTTGAHKSNIRSKSD